MKLCCALLTVQDEMGPGVGVEETGMELPGTHIRSRDW